MIARTSGTTDATIAPNANSRIRNVSGIVSRSEPSSSVEISSLMSSLMNVLLMTWIVEARVGRPRRVEDRPDRREQRRDPGVVAGDPLPTIRTVVPSALTRPGLGRRLERVENWSKVGVSTPLYGALAAPQLADEPVDGGLERRVAWRRPGRRR